MAGNRTDIVLGKGEWIGATRLVTGEMPALVLARATTPHPLGTPASDAELLEAVDSDVVVIAFTGWPAMLALLDLTQNLAARVAEATGMDLETETP